MRLPTEEQVLDPAIGDRAWPGRTVPEWLSNAVIYEIYPQSFSDSNGDGIGDFPVYGHDWTTFSGSA